MAGYSKLFSTIITSTVWAESDQTRIVWITMLALTDAGGFVPGSVPGLAHVSRVSLKDCKAALDRLSSPDPDSRTKDYEGRRIRAVEGGWLILNYLKYRESRSEDERRKQNAEAQKRWRERNKRNADRKQSKPPSATVSPCRSIIASASADASEGGNDVVGDKDDVLHTPPPGSYDDVLTALAECCGWNRATLTEAEAEELGVAGAQIVQVTSRVTPVEITRRATVFRRLHPDVLPTPAALAREWVKCRDDG